MNRRWSRWHLSSGWEWDWNFEGLNGMNETFHYSNAMRCEGYDFELFFLPLTSSVPANNGIRYYSEKKNTWEKTMIRSHGFEIRNFNIYAFAIAVKNESTPRLVLWFLTRETTMQTIWFWDMSEIFFRRFYIHTLLFLSTVFFFVSPPPPPGFRWRIWL